MDNNNNNSIANNNNNNNNNVIIVNGIYGHLQYDHGTTKSVCKNGIKVITDLLVVSCLLYFVIEGVKKIKNYRYVELDHDHDHHHDHVHGSITKVKHLTATSWQDIVALSLCFVFLFIFTFDLVTSCHAFVTQLVRCQKIEPLERHTNDEA